MSSCRICEHNHNYEGGEICGVCGHRLPPPSSTPVVVTHPLPLQIIEPFLFLGNYHDAFRTAEFVKPFGITHFLNVVPGFPSAGTCFHTLSNHINSHFDEAFKFIEQCARNGGRVLVLCMSGISRSPAVVIAYLMRRNFWPLQHALEWLRQRRKQINITPDLMQQLEEYEKKVFTPNGTTKGPDEMQQLEYEQKVFTPNGTAKDTDEVHLVPEDQDPTVPTDEIHLISEDQDPTFPTDEIHLILEGQHLTFPADRFQLLSLLEE